MVYNIGTMFKINKTTKYIFLALSLAFVFFVGSMNTASAGSSNDYYMGFGLDNSSLYYGNDYSYPSYDYNNYSYSGYDSYDYSYPSYSYDYSSPSYYYDSYDYGCTSCGYSYYQSLPNLVYVPNTNNNCTDCHTPTKPPKPPKPPKTETLDASCTVNPNNVDVNDTVTLAATATGGTGTYQYYWSGSDGLSGSSQVITGRFTTPGTKTVSLTVTSGTQTVTRTCSAYVNQRHVYNPPVYYPPVYNNLTATCSASPSNANVGDNVIWTVYPNGGIGGYSYSWTGTDGLSYGNAYQIQQRYSTPGTKTATVTVTASNGQSVTVSCNANVAGTINSGTPISGIYLNEVPATGISFNLKVMLYTLGLLAWSAFVGFMLISRRKNKLALANRAKIEDFKLENMKRKNLI